MPEKETETSVASTSIPSTVIEDMLTEKKKVLKYSVHCNGMLKRCKICNDTAFGFNFGGLSCESCKAFFRRHAHRIEKLHCHNHNRCLIDLDSRRFCKRCRLQKCFDAGMDKDLLLTQRRRTSANRGGAPCTDLVPLATTTTTTTTPSPQANLIRLYPHEEQILIYNPEPPSPFDLFSNSSPSSPSSSPPLSSSPPSFTTPSKQPSMQQLFEQNCLNIIRKLPDIFQERPLGVPTIVGHATEVVNVFCSQEFFIPGLITFGHFLAPFHQMCKADQLAAVKQAFPLIMMLRSTFYFNFEKDAFLCRQKSDCSEVFYVDLEFFYQKSPTLKELHRELAHIVREELAFDTIIRDLLTLLIIFRPNTSVSCPEFLRYHFFKYCHLLANYLALKQQQQQQNSSTASIDDNFSTAENNKPRVQKKYARLMRLLEMLPALIDIYYHHFRTVNKLKISQTLGEIYQKYETG